MSDHLTAMESLQAKFKKLDREMRIFQKSFDQAIEACETRLDTMEKSVKERIQGRQTSTNIKPSNSSNVETWPILKADYTRYGRQLIMPEIGLAGQVRLKNSSVVIVGAGGLGCPAAAYLAGAGVGKIGIVDGDIVEVSNLHRQILHTTETVGASKVKSIISALRRINPTVTYIGHEETLTSVNALGIIAAYDLVLDCTDTPASRYLVSDACVIKEKSLISASALRLEGQLMVLNEPTGRQGDGRGGPCYRCIFPKPPPPEAVLSCGEGGILGPVVGVMGVLQAIEAIKIIIAQAPQGVAGENASQKSIRQPSMLLFSALESPPSFRTIKLRGRRNECMACSDKSQISDDNFADGSIDYVKFCGGHEMRGVRLQPEQRITAMEFNRIARRSINVDVRDANQFDLCSLPGSINVPYSETKAWQSVEDIPDVIMKAIGESTGAINVICRLGNDSQEVVQRMHELLRTHDAHFKASIRDVQGGFRAWRLEVDPDWPDY